MEVAALEALKKWKPDESTANIARFGHSPPKIEIGTAGPGSFAARASFQFPDSGRFHLVLNGSKSEDGLFPILEGDSGLPEGFVMEVNDYMITSLVDQIPPSNPEAVVQITMEHISRIFEKFNSPPPAPSLTPPPEKEDQPSAYSRKRKAAALTKYVDPVFGQTRLANAILLKQFNLLSKMDTRKDGFLAQPVDDNLYKWSVNLYFDNTSSEIEADLSTMASHDHVTLELNFPAQYPNKPPVVRVVCPFISNGHVAPHGGLCMELLTTSGWAPVNSIDVVCIQIRAMLIQGHARIHPDRQHRLRDYTLEGALQDLRKIVVFHSWNVPKPGPSRMKRRLRREES